MPNGTCLAEVMPNSEKIKPIAVKLCFNLLEAVSRKFCCILVLFLKFCCDLNVSMALLGLIVPYQYCQDAIFFWPENWLLYNPYNIVY